MRTRLCDANVIFIRIDLPDSGDDRAEDRMRADPPCLPLSSIALLDPERTLG
jgi:hypothetical protein